ncbi:MAG: amidohydrolase family protein [Deltaproteobacteria bacterium]|nr:amidohydrolase family protein [Deltaproteobacteria bacterium]
MSFLLTLLLLPTCYAQPTLAIPGIIDAHTHTEFDDEPEAMTQIPRTPEEYRRELREAGAVGAVAHTHIDDEDYHDMRRYNVVHCAGVGPRPHYKDVERGLRSGKYRCIKIYLGYVHQYANDAHYEPLYKLAKKFDVPVVFHTGDTYDRRGLVKYAHPLTIDEVAVDHPEVKFVIAHCGNPWITTAAMVARKNPNVYLDGSALLTGDMDDQRPERVEEHLVRPLSWLFGYVNDPRKLLFGSDWPLNDIASYARAFSRAIPREHRQAVFHDNAVAVFHLNRR